MIQVALSTLAIYLFLILAIRTVGRRVLSQLSATDLVVIILLGSAVETAMVHASTSLKVGLVSATTLLIANRSLAALSKRSRRFRHFIGGGPIVLVHNGEIVLNNVTRVGFTEDDLIEALREQEIACFEDVRYAILEVDGRINIIRRFPHPAAS